MPRSYVFILLALILFLTKPVPGTSCKRCSRARAFLEASCRTTRYPQLCVKTLIGSIIHQDPEQYHNPRDLAKIALTASLARARRARAYMAHMAVKINEVQGLEQQALTNCLDQINNSMDQISQSITELGRINDNGSPDEFTWHSGNVMTWTSTALTDENTCLEMFPGGKRGRRVQAAVRAQLADVSRVTSNALALVNRFVMRHKRGRGRP